MSSYLKAEVGVLAGTWRNNWPCIHTQPYTTQSFEIEAYGDCRDKLRCTMSYRVLLWGILQNSFLVAGVRQEDEALVMHDGEAARLCGCSELAMAICLQVHQTR